jgi:hypothetical protein
MIALSALSVVISPSAKEYLRWELARMAAAGGKPLSINAVVVGTALATSAGVVALYGVMVTWGIA